MSDDLSADFTKRFPGGATVHGQLRRPARGRGVTVVFGPSGCGKTTVLRCLAGLDRPEDGFIRMGNETWFDQASGRCLTPQQRGIGFLFQEYALFPHLDVARNIGFGLTGVSAAERERRIGAELNRFGLVGLEARRPSELSGGQQQRVALARSLARRPRLLLLDEPLSALDAALREELRGELRKVLSALDIPVLLVTHDRAEALALGDEILVMSDGETRQSGPVLEVFNHPADAGVARIVGVETLLPGRVLRVDRELATIEVGTAELTAMTPAGDAREVIVCIRGEDVILEREGGTLSTSPRNRLRARIVGMRPDGQLIRVELDAGFPLFARVTRPACEDLSLGEGAMVIALIKAPAIHLIPR